MQTRRDQLQAYRFVIRRVMAGLLHGEPDAPESPMRKLAVATFSGVMVGVLVVAAFGVWGLIFPGGAKGLTDAGVLIIEEETGTAYVYNQETELLYPALNYVSARLILDDSNVERRNVSRESLDDFERGPTLGIVGAPDSLVDEEELIDGPWVVCSHEEPGLGGAPRQIGSLLIGREVDGTAFGPNEALEVEASGQQWVIWRDTRMRANTNSADVIPGEPVPINPAFLNALPSGPDWAMPSVEGIGEETSYSVAGENPPVGRVYKVVAGGGQPRWYVALRDGIAPVTETEATLIVNEIGDQQELNTTVSDVAQSDVELTNEDLPTNVPTAAELRNDNATPLCASYTDTEGETLEVEVTQGGNVPTATEQEEQQDDNVNIAAVTGLIDRVAVDPGGGALVGELPGPGQADEITTYYLISSQGYAFPLRSPEVVSKLGYDTESAVPLPANFLRLIPQGPTLDPEKAREPVAVIPQTGETPQAPAIPGFGDN